MPHRDDTVRLGMGAIGECDTVTFSSRPTAYQPKHYYRPLRAAENTPKCIWRTGFKGTPGAPVLFPSWAFDELQTLPSGKGGGYVAKQHEGLVRGNIDVSSKWELFDVDALEDLALLQKHLAH